MKSNPFFILNNSPWPFILSTNIFFLIITLILYLHYNLNLLIFSIIFLIITLYFWFYDIFIESNLLGTHTKILKKSIKFSFLLFIFSEIFFFISFFWSFFHSVINPTFNIGCLYPPLSIISVNYITIPLLNTLILLSSAITLTYSHYILINKKIKESLNYLIITILLGLIFTLFQIFEYNIISFSISCGIFGSIFFILTGFHGAHVLLGTIFLYINYIKFYNYYFSIKSHYFYEISIWYWHFVDIVWIFLYFLLYFCWS